MTEAVLTRLRDFSRKTDFLRGCKPHGRPGPRGPDPGGEASERGRAEGGEGPCSRDIAGALAWLRWELMEMRSQDQVLIRQLMELHAGIQELKQELSEEHQNDDDDDEDEEDDDDDDGGDDDGGDDDDDDDECEECDSWESCSETGSGSVYSSESECSASCLKTAMTTPLWAPPFWLRSTANGVTSRRSSVP